MTDGPFPRQTEDREFIEGLSELEIRMIAHEIGVCRDCIGPTPKGPLDKFGRCEDCADEMDRQVREANRGFGYTPGEDDPPEKGAWPGERYMA